MTHGLRPGLNRAVLATVGLVLLLGGVWLAITPASWAPSLPGRWPDPGSHTALLDAERLTGLRTHGWWTPTVMAASIAATVLFALWCAGQLRGGSRPLVPLSAPGSALRTRALEDVVTQQAAAIGGVARCRTRVLVRRRHLYVRLHVWLQPSATPAAVLPDLTALAAQTETAITPYLVRTEVRFAVRSHRMPHVR
ncbi:hypothetical protein [Streptomyces sp. NPDC050535]|uniref:hypothetical protein n=1 Tax=Streptomyces sp. NPDC050535 TaxID=3365626 RepID=UPI00378C63E5